MSKIIDFAKAVEYVNKAFSIDIKYSDEINKLAYKVCCGSTLSFVDATNRIASCLELGVSINFLDCAYSKVGIELFEALEKATPAIREFNVTGQELECLLYELI